LLTFDHVHGKARRVPRLDTAFAHRDKEFLFLINTNWEDPTDDSINIQWTKDLFEKLSIYSANAVYVNYLGEESNARIQSAYGIDHIKRLEKLKSQYDPTNFFRKNQNIKPVFIS
jgi:hypothetical protein